MCTISLTNSTRAWRNAYRTDDGIPGKDLLELRSPKTQLELLLMTQKYLEKDYGGYGDKY